MKIDGELRPEYITDLKFIRGRLGLEHEHGPIKYYCRLISKREEERPWFRMRAERDSQYYYDVLRCPFWSEEIFGPELEPYITSAATRFLHEHERLTNVLPKVRKTIISWLESEGISYTFNVDIARDIEAPEWEALKIHIEIGNRNYSDILNIWSRVCKEVYKELEVENAKKLYIVMRKARSS
ncbi:hypothetical protein ES703_00800 [subsurface metagenome]